MSEETQSTDPAGESGEEGFKPITSQEQLNKIIGGRVEAVRSQFADYDDLKAKAEQFDEIEQANKSEADKAAERIAELEQQLTQTQTEALRSRVQAKFGISNEDAELFLTGNDEAALTKQAERLAEHAADRNKQGNRAPYQGRTPNKPQSSDERDTVRNLFGA